MIKNKQGNVFLTIIGILAVFSTLAVFFMDSTIHEKHSTERSHLGTQAQCLAEAGLERAMSILQQQLNDPGNFKDSGHISAWIRGPMAKKSGSFESALGKDAELDSASLPKQIIFTKEDLEGAHGTELTELVKYMAGENADYDIEVTVDFDKAFSIAHKPGNDYLVPGVQMPWNCHSGVNEFFSNDGFVALTLALPTGLKWLALSVSVDVPVVGTLFEIDIIDIIGQFAEWCNFTAVTELISWTEINTLLENVLPDSIYPYQITLDSDIFPTLSDKSGLPLPVELSADLHVEKYGMFRLKSKATIKPGNQNNVTRTIHATKEFKCADVEPVAPMYSMFISNLNNEPLIFNDIGGTLSVNNFANYNVITGNPSEIEKREYPGLIRVNGTYEMSVNVGFIGNPLSPDSYNGDNGLNKSARGAEWLLMLNNKISDVFVEKEMHKTLTTKKAEYNGSNKEVPEEEKVSPSVGNSSSSNAPAPVEADKPAPEGEPIESITSMGKGVTDAAKNFLAKALSGVKKLNVMPNKNKWGISLLKLPFHYFGEEILDKAGIGGIGVKDPMVKWEWPMAGVGYSYYRVPFPTPSRTVTQLFGDSALFPTLTREIEGNVTKVCRQWHSAIVSYPLGPIPLGNQIPTPWGPILPIPIPMWHTHDVSNKYGYNFAPLKSPKNKTEVDSNTNVYDPKYMKNAPPNLYSLEQYAKKAVYYYPTAQDFYDDIPNRLKYENGQQCLNLNGITYVADSLTLPPENVDGISDTLYVTGRGGIVIGGNLILKGHICDAYDGIQERAAGTPRTVFSMICRKGGLIIESGPPNIEFEGSLYTDKGVAISAGRSIRIIGNWVTNKFSKSAIQGDIRIEYTAYKTRSSMTSVNPNYGIYDPERYIVSLAPGYSSVRVK